MFKNIIQKARKSVGMRKFDNFFHAYNNKKKDKAQKKSEAAKTLQQKRK
jgi:hypothetical protein